MIDFELLLNVLLHIHDPENTDPPPCRGCELHDEMSIEIEKEI